MHIVYQQCVIIICIIRHIYVGVNYLVTHNKLLYLKKINNDLPVFPIDQLIRNCLYEFVVGKLDNL